MESKKQEYVKPIITQLTYTADATVAAGGFCKGNTGTGTNADPCSSNPDCDTLGS